MLETLEVRPDFVNMRLTSGFMSGRQAHTIDIAVCTTVHASALLMVGERPNGLKLRITFTIPVTMTLEEV